MDKERKNGIYKIIMIVAIAVFLTFMVTSISLYTYFLNNPISITSKSSSSSKDIAGALQ